MAGTWKPKKPEPLAPEKYLVCSRSLQCSIKTYTFKLLNLKPETFELETK